LIPPTFSRRYLNFLSLHPVSQKRDIVIGIDRAFLLLHLRYYQKNFELSHLNDYPLNFIKILHSHLKFLIQRHNYFSSNNKKRFTKYTWPYSMIYNSISKTFQINCVSDKDCDATYVGQNN